MAADFHTRIRASLADTNLQAALDANAERRVRVRKSAFASLDDPEGMRQRAHAVRAEVVSHLDAGRLWRLSWRLQNSMGQT